MCVCAQITADEVFELRARFLRCELSQLSADEVPVCVSDGVSAYLGV